MNDHELMGELRQRIFELEVALYKIANPINHPKGEEATLLEMEIKQIAEEALAC